MSYMGLLTAYGLAVIPRTLPHYKKYTGINEMRKWPTLTREEKCAHKNKIASEENKEKLKVYDTGKVTTFAITGIKKAEEWYEELLEDVDEEGIKNWMEENNCIT